MRLPARHHVEIGILRGVSEPQTLIANGVVVRQDVAIRIPVVAVIRPLFRPIGVVVGVSRHHLARASFALDVVLQGEKEKSGAVRWGRDARAWWIMRGYPETVVIGAGHRVVRIELEVGAEVNRILLRTELLADAVHDLAGADRKGHFECLAARVVVARFGRDAQVRLHVGVAPFRCELARRSVALEVVRQNDRWVAADALVARVARSDSTVC